MTDAAPTSGFPRTARALRDALAVRGVHPRKHHGQCFLTDVQAVDAIVRDAEVSPGDAVVEVGTGTGLLTHALCEAGASIDTFDIDPQVQAVARSLREWPPTVRFHAGDALEGKHALAPSLRSALVAARAAVGPGRVRFVSNLPYNAATPVLLGLLALEDPPDTITAMVQKEVAEKLLCPAGEGEYGPPSVLRALQADGKILRRFPAQCFWPQPQVVSALLRLVPRRPRAFPAADERALAAFLLGLFSRRRKVLSTAVRAAREDLSAEQAHALCEAEGLDPRTRPEDVPPATLLALWRRAAAA